MCLFSSLHNKMSTKIYNNQNNKSCAIKKLLIWKYTAPQNYKIFTKVYLFINIKF